MMLRNPNISTCASRIEKLTKPNLWISRSTTLYLMTNSFEIINVSNILFEVLIFCNAKFLNCSKVVRKKENFNRSIFSLLSNDRLNFSVLIQTGPKPNFCRCKGGSFFFWRILFFYHTFSSLPGYYFSWREKLLGKH